MTTKIMKTLPEIMLDPDYINRVEEALAHMLDGYRDAALIRANEYHSQHPKRREILNKALANSIVVDELLYALRTEHDKIHS